MMVVSWWCASLVGEREVQMFEVPGLWLGRLGLGLLLVGRI